MIRFNKPAEPPTFKVVRKKGQDFLSEFVEKNGKLPSESKHFKNRDYWTDCEEDLEDGFLGLCAYSAMSTNGAGETDHFIAKTINPSLAYEWSNYRYTTAKRNRKKNNSTSKILDPFEVENEWFEVIPESGELTVTDRISDEETLAIAKDTIRILGLDTQQMRKARRRMAKPLLSIDNRKHLDGMLELLHCQSPLVARAVSRYWEEVDRNSKPLR